MSGFDVVVASHDPREAPALREVGAVFIDDRMEALLGSQVVITSLRTTAEVENLYLGDEGLLELMDPGTFCIDLSISSPRLAREIQAVAAVSDIEVLDAPIVCVGEHEQPSPSWAVTANAGNALAALPVPGSRHHAAGVGR